jgi:hypothetical protein
LTRPERRHPDGKIAQQSKAAEQLAATSVLRTLAIRMMAFRSKGVRDFN